MVPICSFGRDDKPSAYVLNRSGPSQMRRRKRQATTKEYLFRERVKPPQLQALEVPHGRSSVHSYHS